MGERGLPGGLRDGGHDDALRDGHRLGVEADRAGELRRDDAAGAEAAFDRVREAVVDGQVGVGHADDAVVDEAADERLADVDRGGGLVAGGGEVDDEPVALLDGGGVETDGLAGVRGVVHPGLGLADAVLPVGDVLAGLLLRPLAEVLEHLEEGVLPVGAERVFHALLADGEADAGLGGEVADHHLRHAAVGPHERRGVLHEFVVAHVAHRHDLQALAEDVAGGGVAAARRHPADVGRVPHAGGEPDDLVLVEDGGHDDHVVGVGASAVVGVVREEGVALGHVVEAVELQQPFDRLRVGGHVSRVERLTDEPPLPVEHAAAEVVRLADDGRVAGAEDRLLHLADDAVQPCPQDFVGDGVYACHGGTSLTSRR